MIKRFNLIAFIILAASVSAFSIGSSPPSWLRQAAAASVPSYDKDVPAVVLLDEEEIRVEKDGAIVTTERYAIKILTRDGRGLAVARAFYFASAGKISELEAWLVYSGGNSKDYGKKETLDLISDPDDVYNEGRIKLIDATNDVSVGDVFGFTVEKRDPPLFYQDIWQFQGRLPVIVSRYTLNLPSDWSATNITFNHGDIAPTVNGSSYTWQLTNLAPIPPERRSPSVQRLAPIIAINFGPVDSSAQGTRTFSSWTDVSSWATAMYDPQVVVNDEVAAKARELTAGLETELEKIKAIGKYVQNLQYISIDIGVAYGNGYKPRSSATVMSRGYGDCKDKATLMRAMLQVLKIDSFPVVIYSGDPEFVRKEWASPRQFNHCIIAVRVSPETKSWTVVDNENLGRLLIFDATDDMTPVGDLPDYLQGSFGLVVAGDKGDLVSMPITPPDENALVRTVNITLDGTGSIKGSINEATTGQSSRDERAMLRRLSVSDYQKAIERWLTRGATAAKLESMDPKDDHDGASFDLSVEFSAPSYGQLMQGRLLMFNPTIVNRTSAVYLTDKERYHPVTMDSSSFEETAVFDLPEGFSVDEMPDPVSIKTEFGSYVTTFDITEGKLTFTRKMVTERTTIPVGRYKEVREFYTKILNAENTPVVLLKN